MIKIAIIEDEPMIMRNLAVFIERLDPDFSDINCFSQGKDFLAFLEHNSPDIVISDIRLSDTLGTELLKQCKKTNPHIRFVIISAYKNFEYAKTAIEYKADAYLTKPIDRNALAQTLIGLKSELLKNISYHYNRSVTEIFRDTLKKCETGEISSNSELKSALKSSNIENVSQYGIFNVCITVDNIASISNAHSRNSESIMLSLSNFILMPDFNANGICIYKHFSTGNSLDLLFAIPTDAKENNDLFASVCEQLDFIKSKCLEYLNFSFKYVVIGNYENIFALLDGRFAFRADLTLCELEPFIDICFSAMALCLSKNNRPEYDKFVKKLYMLLKIKETEDVKLFKHLIMLLRDKLSDHFNVYVQSLPGLSLNASPQDFHEFCKNIFDCGPEPESSTLAEKAEQYIRKNISSPSLTLSEISNSCYTHPVYLSRIFKQTYNTTIHSYITSLRIAKAKDMLRRGESLNTIAYECGYKTVKYFSKTFKQIVGTSPSNYKKGWKE